MLGPGSFIHLGRGFIVKKNFKEIGYHKDAQDHFL